MEISILELYGSTTVRMSFHVLIVRAEDLKATLLTLRRAKMDLEDQNLELNNKRTLCEEKIDKLVSEIQSNKVLLEDQRRLNDDRKNQIIKAQSEIDALNARLRSNNNQKFNEDADKMKYNEDFNVQNHFSFLTLIEPCTRIAELQKRG